MGQWSRGEIESAFQAYSQAVIEIAKSGDWASYADQFTEDAVYLEHSYGEMHGREQIRSWISSTMGAFPGTEMPFFVKRGYYRGVRTNDPLVTGLSTETARQMTSTRISDNGRKDNDGEFE